MSLQDVETEVERQVLVNTAIAIEHASNEICTDFKSLSIDMSSEYKTNSVNVNIAYEKESDTVDFNGSVEMKSIEVGTEVFGEKAIVCMDVLTSHETRLKVEDTCCEFIYKMVDGESQSETIFTEDVCSQEEVRVCDISMEVKSTTAESSCESKVSFMETGIAVYKNSCDASTETITMEMREEASSYELIYMNVDCEMMEVVNEIVVKTEEPENAEVTRTEDESVCYTISMNDIGTVAQCNVVHSSQEMEVKCVDNSGDWTNVINLEDQAIETEKSEIVTVSLSSEYESCTTDVQCDEKKPIMSESGYETKPATVDSFSVLEVRFVLIKTLILR